MATSIASSKKHSSRPLAHQRFPATGHWPSPLLPWERSSLFSRGQLLSSLSHSLSASSSGGSLCPPSCLKPWGSSAGHPQGAKVCVCVCGCVSSAVNSQLHEGRAVYTTLQSAGRQVLCAQKTLIELMKDGCWWQRSQFLSDSQSVSFPPCLGVSPEFSLISPSVHPSVCPPNPPWGQLCPLCQPRAPRAGEAGLCFPVVKINSLLSCPALRGLPHPLPPVASSFSQPHGGEWH